MSKKQVVGVTNFLSLCGVILLVYWVFAFSLSVVFGFRVFRENISELFGMSILGILAVLAGALVVNVSFNLSRIAERAESEASQVAKRKLAPRIALLMIPFPLIAGVLVYGDSATSHRKKARLIDSATFVVEENNPFVTELANYSFSKEYVERASSILKILGKEDESFPGVSAIVLDTIGDKRVLLNVGQYSSWREKSSPKKVDFIFSSSKEERTFLFSALSGEEVEPLYSANDGRYELYYPVTVNGKYIVLYFSEYSRYGKYGSS